MHRIIIFGNSGSGKSTLARHFTSEYGLAHLDLDTLAWQDSSPPERKPIEESFAEISRFINGNQSWIIEGCYSDLLSLAMKTADKVIFLNPGVETCMDNCKSRPFEPHKYESQEAQDKNLEMLLNWVRQYPDRVDEFSLMSHQKLFNEFAGNKTEYLSNKRDVLL